MLESDQLIHKLVRRSKEADLLYNKYQEQVKKFDQERAIILERLIAENLQAQDLTRQKLDSLANVEWEKGNRTPKPTPYPQAITSIGSMHMAHILDSTSDASELYSSYDEASQMTASMVNSISDNLSAFETKFVPQSILMKNQTLSPDSARSADQSNLSTERNLGT